ncbi:hypothetical protein GYB61_11225 [bacterium]|nr:hypothetical protein [bacterium]
MNIPFRKVMAGAAPALLAASLLAPVGSAVAQPSLDSLGLSGDAERAIRALINRPASTPGSAFGSPIAFGSNLGDVFFAVGGTEALPGESDKDYDGGAVLGFGLGNASSAIGAEITVGLISIEDDFAEDGNIGFKVHTKVTDTTSVAVGVENLGRFGQAEGTNSSHYVALATAWQLRPGVPENPLTLITNIGVGDNRFDDFGEDGTGAFGSAALFFTPQVGAIVDWTGRQLNAGVSFVPFRSFPMNITVGAANVTERNHEDVRFSGSVGFSFNFLN